VLPVGEGENTHVRVRDVVVGVRVRVLGWF
jgi:hypothetical protein